MAVAITGDRSPSRIWTSDQGQQQGRASTPPGALPTGTTRPLGMEVERDPQSLLGVEIRTPGCNFAVIYARANIEAGTLHHMVV